MRILIIPFGGFFEAVRSVHALALRRGYWSAPGHSGGPGKLEEAAGPYFCLLHCLLKSG